MEQSAAATKARLDAIYSQGMQDVVHLEASAGGENGGSSPPMARGVAIVQVDTNWFRCSICSRLLKPPVFQCKRGHLSCGCCRAGMCGRCKNGGGGGGGGGCGSFDSRNAVVEDIISVSKFKCPHSGCHDFFPYPDLLAHSGACLHAPCLCTEPGCSFASSPATLLRHLTADHSWPGHTFVYGKVLPIRAVVPVRQLLLADEDGGVFVLVVGPLGAVTAASLVCVRAAGGGASQSQPRYTAALRASSMSMVTMETLTSTDRPGEVAVDKLPCVLAVPTTYLASAGADGASKEVSLKIQIKKVSVD